MPGLRFLKLSLLCLSFCVSVIAVASPAGLSFYSNDRPIAERTQYDVFDGYKKIKGDSIVVAFDLAITDPADFGHIMDIFSKSGEEFNLVLVNFRDKRFVYIDFNEISSGVKLSFPIDRNECRDGNWHSIRLCFDRKTKKIVLTVNDSIKEVPYDFTKKLKEINVVFGRSAKYTDVPCMAIRNLQYEDGHSSFYFPFTEMTGETVHDHRGKKVGVVECPDWMANRYYYWKKERKFWLPGLTYITHDRSRHTIVGYGYDSTFVYDINRRDFMCRVNDCPERFQITSGGLFYNDVNDEMIIYNTLPKSKDPYSIAKYDYLEDRFVPLDRAVAASKLHHHNLFADSSGHKLYLFGGYGNYSYSNQIYSYTYGSHRWKKETFSGDTIAPRFFAASGTVSQKDGTNIVYLFGGFGNLSGRQEDGAWNLYDCYRIDVDRQHICKMFDMALDSINFVPAGQLVPVPEESCFYILAYDHNEPKTKGYVYRIGMDGQSLQRVSDGIDIVSEKIESEVYLFYDAFYQKLVCVTQEIVPEKGANIVIYSLSFPPCIPVSMHGCMAPGLWWSCGSILVILLAGGVWIWRRKRKNDRLPDLAGEDVCSETDVDGKAEHEPIRNSIWLLGDFCVFDRNARDITYRFSSKIRQLFLLVLLNSGKESEGISSAEISLELWPEKSDSKNIRGVTVKALRDVLADLDGIELIHENHKWHIIIDPATCTCDYAIIVNAQSSQMHKGADITFRVIDLLMRGKFLPLYNYQWLDSVKVRFEEHVERLIRPCLETALSEKDYPFVYKLVNCLQFTHPLNEEYLKMQIKALRNMGKSDQALSKFRFFVEEYRKSYGVDPKQDDLL